MKRKLTIDDLIRREGRQPGGGAWPPKYKIVWGPGVYFGYPKSGKQGQDGPLSVRER